MNFRRSIITAELWRPKVARRWERIDFCVFLNDPLRKSLKTINRDTDRRLVFKFRDIWLTEMGEIVHMMRARK